MGGYCTGKEYHLFAQQPRHVGMDIAGMGVVNPLGMIQASIHMLDALGMTNHSIKLKLAIEKTLVGGQVTKDLGGTLSTKEFMDKLISNL